MIERLPPFLRALEFAAWQDIMRPVKTVAVINQKGGVGKTTTVVNLGAALAARGHDVCLIDLDAQSQLTLHLGVEVPQGGKTIYDVVTRGAALSSATVNLTEHLAIVPSEVDLVAAEMELVGAVGREQILADRLTARELPYEFVLIDCPPSLGLLTLNALAAADELLVPLQAHFFGLQGLGRLFETVSLVRQRINPRLRVGGVVLCMFERQTRLAGEVVSDLADFLASARGTDAPWAEARVFQSVIRRNVKLAECPSYGKTIFDYEPKSHGAEDYGALADEFLACFAPVSTSPPPAPAGTPQGEADAPRPVEVEAPPAESATVRADEDTAAPAEPNIQALPADGPDETYRPVPQRATEGVTTMPTAPEMPVPETPADLPRAAETSAAETQANEKPSGGASSWSGPASAPSGTWPPE